MTEARLTAAIVKAIRSADPAAWILKLHGHAFQRAGVPDLLVVRDGLAYWIEVKLPGKAATRLQLHVIAELLEAGAAADIAWSVEEALRIVGLK